MGILTTIYRQPLGLLTDLYELTMAQGYWKLGLADRHAAFHLFFRTLPFAGGYAVAAGLECVVDYLENFRLDSSDIDYLATITGNDGQPLFEPPFLSYLKTLRFTCDVDAVPEGTVVFPHEPLLRVTGPIIQGQLMETALLNLVNFQTLIATKAARICGAAGGQSVMEFGLRRAQGIDGSLAVSRSAYIGGCSSTSNVLAGKLFGIPVKGTHAHSWVMAFDDELESFDAYARVMPNNCVFLVDTYDTIEGVRHAIQIGLKLRSAGHKMIGIRLDSGDLAYLSIEARRMLDEAGLSDAVIVASNDLDEHIIENLRHQEAAITVWGVGTRLATGHDQPALGGVYKLTAMKDAAGVWQPRIKLSEQVIKMTTPGVLGVRRFRDRAGLPNQFLADAIYDEAIGIGGDGVEIVDPMDPTRRKRLPADQPHEELLAPIFRGGKCVYKLPRLESIRQRAAEQLAACHAGIKRLINPHRYPVGLEKQLHELKTQLVLAAREHRDREQAVAAG
jgi:nicotinate phosphoribosyltransferase